MTGAGGKRAGSRRGSKPQSGSKPLAALLALAAVGCLIGWGYLVYLAVLAGQDLRAGESGAWQLLVAIGAGAVLTLFAAFMLIARLLRLLGVTRSPIVAQEEVAAPGGGRRIRTDI